MQSFFVDPETILEVPFIRSIAVLLASIVAAWLVEAIVCRTLARAAMKTRTDLDDRFIEVIRRPIFLSVLFYGLTWALDPLDLPLRAQSVIESLLETFAVLIWAKASFQIGGLVLELLSRRSTANSVLQQRTLPIFNMLLKGATFGIAVYFLFLAWSINVTAWLASAGIIGLAVGFAAQDSLANLFAGIFIIADAPYRVGDFIVLDDGIRGQVTRIGFRSTRILTMDDVEITIPNSVIGKSKISNEAGGPSTKQRVAVSVDAAYGADVDRIREVLLSCVQGVGGLCPDPAPTTRFHAFGPSGLSFKLLVWIENPETRDAILDVLYERVYKAFNAAGLEIPFSKHDLYLKEMPKSVRSHLEPR